MPSQDGQRAELGREKDGKAEILTHGSVLLLGPSKIETNHSGEAFQLLPLTGNASYLG